MSLSAKSTVSIFENKIRFSPDLPKPNSLNLEKVHCMLSKCSCFVEKNRTL